MRPPSLPALLLLPLAVLPACGSSSESAAAPQNQPPRWSEEPASVLHIGQGQTRSFPIQTTDPEGDPVTVTLADAGGLEAGISADGKSIVAHAGYTVTGTQLLEIQLDDGHGGHAGGKLSVEVAPLGWAKRTTWSSAGPDAREHGAMIDDDAHGRAILIAGSGYNPQLRPLADVWAIDLASSAWTKLSPTGSPVQAGGSKRVAQIPGKAVAYLWGGYSGLKAEISDDDLVRVDFSGEQPSFEVIPQTNTPPARSLHAFAYDPGSDRFFMFGGIANAPFGDTWTMTLKDGVATWTDVTPDPSPSARYGFFYGADQESGRLHLYSGAQGGNPLDPAQDTWVLDMRADPPAWALVADGAAAGVPPGRRNGCGYR